MGGHLLKIAHIEVRNFRGIQKMDWSPEPGINCLIGPGDSTKTTVLDAIELALNPRSLFVGEDTDFYNLNCTVPITIIITLTGLPTEFYSDERYGLHLRGWDASKKVLNDEPKTGCEDALSIRVTIDPESLEGRWSIFNDRLIGEADPPSLRYKDSRRLSTTRLGPYAERHLGWSRNSILSKIGEQGNMNAQLAVATRAARDAFSKSDKTPFADVTARAEELGKLFSVPVKDKYAAELDIQGALITSGGVALHDGKLALRTLGTGSSRLIVSALQHSAGGSQVALVDELEHGLEPHRIARLLKYLISPPTQEGELAATSPQVFMTSHSPVVIRELRANNIFAVRSIGGVTSVQSIEESATDVGTAQRHLRSTPEAFLARRVLIGEGKTEYGLLRGLDSCWSTSKFNSFAYQGVVATDGGGIPKALALAKHLLMLGFDVGCVLDSDQPPSGADIDEIQKLGGKVFIWPDSCSTEQRMFCDLPWATVQKLVAYAVECDGEDRILHTINTAMKNGQQNLTSTVITLQQESDALRTILGDAAKTDRKCWFHDIERAEHVANLVFHSLAEVNKKPFASILADVRKWIDD